jgi:catechol 2,3-dioxygenase-like lactoylglutathione lyase family enzyme
LQALTTLHLGENRNNDGNPKSSEFRTVWGPGMTTTALFILYVKDQDKSTDFYRKVLGLEPQLYVPGMTEFFLTGGASLGLMPEDGIRKLLGKALPKPSKARGVPRAEVYLMVDDPVGFHRRALEQGAKELSELKDRDWGHRVAYSLDPDGHVFFVGLCRRDRQPGRR